VYPTIIVHKSPWEEKCDFHDSKLNNNSHSFISVEIRFRIQGIVIGL